MSSDAHINQILHQEINEIPDEVTKEICQLAVSLAQEGINRGEVSIGDFVSKGLDSRLTQVFRKLKV